MAIPREWVQLLGQAIAAIAVIASNQSSIKAEVAPIKTEQAVTKIAVENLTEKVSRIEKKVGE